MSNFAIRTMDQMREKYDLITNLLDIQVAVDIINDGKEKKQTGSLAENPIDVNYDRLNCDIRNLESHSKDYQMIEKYVKNTCHRGYDLDIIDCFEIKREGEDRIFNPDNLGNKKLLWHGSRFSNFCGILSQGMRIAPPEAPCSGFLFGKGVYFADLISKSFHYTRPDISGGIGTFVLCEVALGNQRPLARPDCYAHNLPSGFHSTKAIGVVEPDPAESIFVDCNSVEIPLGRQKDVPGGGMGANEFVVYNTNQIKMRYIVRCKRK